MSKKDFSVQMGDILKEITDNVEESIDIALKKVPQKLVKRLRSTSPSRKSGRYAKGWTVKRLDKRSAVVYNATLPGYTHLLENGHVIRNQYGEYGRTKPIKHIAPAEEEAIEDFINELMDAKL